MGRSRQRRGCRRPALRHSSCRGEPCRRRRRGRVPRGARSARCGGRVGRHRTSRSGYSDGDRARNVPRRTGRPRARCGGADRRLAAERREAQGEFQQAARWESGTSCSRIPSNRLLAGFPERDDRDLQQPSCWRRGRGWPRFPPPWARGPRPGVERPWPSRCPSAPRRRAVKGTARLLRHTRLVLGCRADGVLPGGRERWHEPSTRGRAGWIGHRTRRHSSVPPGGSRAASSASVGDRERDAYSAS